MSNRYDVEDANATRRERARLVDAEDVDPREDLYGTELLHEEILLREPHHGDREGEAREQHEALRDHSFDRRHRAAHGVTPTAFGIFELPDDEKSRDW